MTVLPPAFAAAVGKSMAFVSVPSAGEEAQLPRPIGPAPAESIQSTQAGGTPPVCLEDRVSAHADDPAEVRAFCAAHGLLGHAGSAITLAEACFPRVQGVKVLVRQDPENDDEWLLVKVRCRATPDEALAAYKRYVREWTKGVEMPTRAKVRLSYGLA